MKNKVINLLVFGRFPTERAYGVHVVSVAKAYSKLGYKTTIFYPSTDNEKTIRSHPNEYFENKDIDYKEVHHTDITKYLLYKILPKSIQGLFWSITAYLWSKKIKHLINDSEQIFWSTNPILLLGSYLDSNYIIFELHGRARKIQAIALKLLDRKAASKSIFISSSEYGYQDLSKRGLKTNIQYLPNGVDLETFYPSSDLNNKDLNNNNCLHLGYVGQLETYGVDKGMYLVVDSLIKAIKETPHKEGCGSVKISIIGGPEKSVEELDKYLKEIQINLPTRIDINYLGQKKQSELQSFISGFDIGIVPYPKEEHIALYSSPMKIFEYAACGVAIIASDIPAHRSLEQLGLGLELYKAEEEGSLATLFSRYLHKKNRKGKESLSNLSLMNISVRDSLSWEIRGEKTLNNLLTN